MTNRFITFLRQLGPGLITGASDDDPSGIATYSQAGARFGMATLWTALLTFPLMAGVQGMCARIGLVTKQGLTTTLKEHYPKGVLYLMLCLSFPAITLNIGADIQGIGAVCHMMVPRVPEFLWSIGFTALLMAFIIRFPYTKVAAVLKWLCLSLFLYLVVPFIVHVDWWQVLTHTLVPTVTMDREFFAMLVALLGTTISPYLFFWQTTMEAESMNRGTEVIVVDKQLLRHMRVDVNVGMLFSNVVMFFIILTTGTVLFNAGIHHIDTVDQAAKALEPLAGRSAYLLFTLGIIGTGLLAIPVLGGSLSYIMSETFGWTKGLDKRFHEAKGFYITLVVSLLLGLCMEFLGISPINALIYTAVLYGLTAPVMIVVLLHICNNKAIMGEHTNTPRSNILGGATLVLMTAAAVALVWFQFT